MNRLFVAYKPPFISSNAFLHNIKKRYGVKKAGFSGTLDPFATGTLIIAFGTYTKLFRFLKKYPKRYRATLWLGAKSDTLDIEGVSEIHHCQPLSHSSVQSVIASFKGAFTYTPPLFSAKKIGGKRAYEFAHKGKEIKLKPITSTIYDIELLNYAHPFVTFEAVVSEGTYIRSLGEAIAKKLGLQGTLSYLERISEGSFVYENERPLDPIGYLTTRYNEAKKPPEAIYHGVKLHKDDLLIQEEGAYHLVYERFFAIIRITNDKVEYLLNQIPRKWR